MPTKQGSVSLINDPVAQKLLQSTNLARLAYNWIDGTPRVVPIWFQWTGEDVVFGTPTGSPKVKALKTGAKVAITIDGDQPPYKVLLIRGTVTTTMVEGIAKEYAQAAERYYGPEGGKDWVAQAGKLMSSMARVAVKPEWVGILDFEGRFPNALEKAMGM